MQHSGITKRLPLYVVSIATLLLLLVPTMTHAQTTLRFFSFFPAYIEAAPNGKVSIQKAGIEGITVLSNEKEYDFRDPMSLSDFIGTGGGFPKVSFKINLGKKRLKEIPETIDLLLDVYMNGSTCENKSYAMGFVKVKICVKIKGWLHQKGGPKITPTLSPNKYDTPEYQETARKETRARLNELAQKTVFRGIKILPLLKKDSQTGSWYILYPLDNEALGAFKEKKDIVITLVKGLAFEGKSGGKVLFSLERNQGLMNK